MSPVPPIPIGLYAAVDLDFYDFFDQGSLDTSKWVPSNWGAPGGGTFKPANIDFPFGMMRMKVSQSPSVGAEICSKNLYGFGSYEWVFRPSSTAQKPDDPGQTVSGQISSGFTYVDNSVTELDFEVEGDNPNVMQFTTWKGDKTSQNSSAHMDGSKFHRFRIEWDFGRVEYIIDDVLLATHTENVPTEPAQILFNHWGTNSQGWGGLATPGVDRWMHVKSIKFKAR